MRRTGWVCFIAAVVVCVGAGSAAGQDADEERTHVVRPGETLSGISRQYYGTTRFKDLLQQANGIADPKSLRAGQTIRIPPRPTAEPPGPAPEPAPQPAADDGAGECTDSVGRLREAAARVLAGSVPWWLVLFFPVVFVAYLVVYWVASNIVHLQRMSVGAASVCSLFSLLVWIGCALVWVLLWLTLAHAGGGAPDPLTMGIAAAAVLAVGMIASLIVIKLVYRDTLGKTAALWVVSLALMPSCCSPFGLVIGLLAGWW